jgi:hypothetical protein
MSRDGVIPAAWPPSDFPQFRLDELVWQALLARSNEAWQIVSSMKRERGILVKNDPEVKPGVVLETA